MTDMYDRVRRYASAVVADCALERIIAVSRFPSGERHHVFKVSYTAAAGDGRDVVVRVSLSDEVEERSRADREAAVLRKVQGVAAPRLNDFRCDGPWFDAPVMCMEFARGERRELTAAAPEDLERLGTIVAWVHGLPTDDLAEWFPDETAPAYRDGRLAQVAAYLPSVRDPLPDSVQRRLQHAVRLVHETSPPAGCAGDDAALVLLHGDIAGDNVVWSPHPVLIDWEYARVGDPADEIAYLFTQNGLAPSQRQAFWRGYRAGATSSARFDAVEHDVGWWEPVTLIGSSLWWVDRWSRRVSADAAGTVDVSVPKAARYYLDEALRRLDRFERVETRGSTVSSPIGPGRLPRSY